MIKFRTEVLLPRSNARIHLADRLLTIGSCFSDAIGAQLVSNKLGASVNPFGTIYNPLSIHKLIQYAVSNRLIPENSFLQRGEVFLHYDFHSMYSSLDLQELKERIQSAIGATHSFLHQAQWLFITYGTAWVYELKDSLEIVANCHKMQQGLFNKFLLTQKKMLDSFDTMYHHLKLFNPGIQIILTVSPVRHLRETLELNSVSKSILRVACHTLTEQYQDVQYFPAYEILIDDLRDYRFYQSDLIHPSEIAEEYIWQKFGDQYFDEGLKDFMTKWKDIKAALHHRPFHLGSVSHQQFIQSTIKALEELKPTVNVDEELMLLKKQLT
jgi:GSCFA family